MQVNFASNLLPGQGQTEYLTIESQITWGKWFHMQTAMGLVDKDAVDAGNSPTTILRPGLPLGVQTTSGQLLQWDPYATDGTNKLFGFYAGPSESMSMLSGTTEKWIGDILVQGNVKAGSIIMPGQASAGISGKDYEFLLRGQMEGRFMPDDEISAGYMQMKEYTIAAATTTFTVTSLMNRTIFVTDTALAASCTFTLPAPRPGLEFYFAHPSTTAGTALILDGPSTGEFWVGGAAANTISLAGDNTTGLRRVRAVRVTDTTTDVYCYIVDGVAA